MSDNSAIEWTDATWNPTVGCSIVSPGCTNCYAMKMAARLEAMGQPIYQGLTQQSKAGAVWNGKVEQSNWGQVIKPLSWKKPRRVFVNSMSDLFHEAVPDSTIDTVFAIMALCPQHTFQVLTKRAGRMREYMTRKHEGLTGPMMPIIAAARAMRPADLYCMTKWPLPNCWLGISAERQQEWDERTEDLRDTPAAVHFVSAEPLLGPIVGKPETMAALDWVIVGGESGPKARPMHPEWAASLRDQCATAGVYFFFKQWGEFAPDERTRRTLHKNMIRVGKKAAGRLLDGRTHDEFPQVSA